jgi:hypothetical protein
MTFRSWTRPRLVNKASKGASYIRVCTEIGVLQNAMDYHHVLHIMLITILLVVWNIFYFSIYWE